MSEPQAKIAPAAPVIDRRALLVGGGAAFAGLLGYSSIRQMLSKPAPVFLATGQRYDGNLQQTIRDGLLATGLDPAALRGRRVLLKPNLVEPTRAAPHVTTHPAVVVAAAEVFRNWGAHVTAGEGPGHVRDTDMALDASGMGEALEAAEIEFADLNYEDLGRAPNRGKASKLGHFYFPRSVVEADLVVSMPKMKTHHWVGFTASLKNLYGTIPGIKYGWPKNVLHHAGSPETVFDINASLPKTISIIDGIVGMEGDGPILGSPKPMGLLLIGTNPTAVDATCARIMGLDPARVHYMQLAGRRLGPLDDRHIEQRGEAWQKCYRPFSILERPHLQYLRAGHPGTLISSRRPARGLPNSLPRWA